MSKYRADFAMRKSLANRMIRKKDEDGKNWPTRILTQ